MAVANSKAMELAGLETPGPDISMEEVGRDSLGRANGHLREKGINILREAMPPAADAALQEAMRQGMQILNGLGVTTLHDVKLMAEAEAVQTLRVWQQLRKSGEMSLRAWVSLADTQLDAAVVLGLRMGLGDEWLRLGHVKFFADGGMGARTAWMLDAYEDGGTGLPVWDMEELFGRVEKAEAAGFAVMIHSIGNRASREIVNLYERLEAVRPDSRELPVPRNRIEHLQMVEPEDLARLSRLPVTVCMQPFNLVLDINLIDHCIGDRGDRTYSFRDVLDSGVALIFSSDAPVCDPSPVAGIHGAVKRRSPVRDTGEAWHPRQRITVEEAVRAYTSTPAREYGVWAEHGSLSPGKWADLILLDKDIFEVEPLEIGSARVDLTLVGGKVVHGDI